MPLEIKEKRKRPIDALTKAMHGSLVWRTVALISIGLNAVAIVAASYAVTNLPDISKLQFIIPPPPGVIDVVRIGELHKKTVELGFTQVASYINGWTYDSIEDNYRILFENYYSKELETRTKASLRAESYVEKAEEKKAVSMWKYLPDESDFKWCGKVQIQKNHKGVACGIVTGEQKLFIDHNSPLLTRKISYLMFALNVAPNPSTPGKNMFAIKLFRVKRGDRKTLEKELKIAFEKGVLPPEEENGYAAH